MGCIEDSCAAAAILNIGDINLAVVTSFWKTGWKAVVVDPDVWKIGI